MSVKLKITVIFILLINTITAQEIIYFEDFEHGIPSDYKTYDLDSLDQQPGAFSLNYRGIGWLESKGSASSISFYKPVGQSNDWMITKAISIPALKAGNKIILAWQELTPDYNYRDSYKVFLNEKDQEVSSFNNLIYDSPSTLTSTFIRYITIDISAYANKTIYLAFQNDAKDKYLLYIDNITIVQSPKNAISSIKLNNTVYNKVNSVLNINGSILNYGWDTLKSFQFNYQVDNGPIQRSHFSNLNFLPFTGDSYASFHQLKVPFGKHTISFWVDSPNGDNISSKVSKMDIFGYRPQDYLTRNVLLEQFTSSTCLPCKIGNKKIKEVLKNLSSQPVVVKYQQDFPEEGDPYCTDETFKRSWYYNIFNIPYTVLDGNSQLLNPLYIKEEDITKAAKREGLVNFNVRYAIDEINHSIHIKGTYKPTVDLIEGTRLMIAIKEKLTSKNIATNGETEFNNVVKKFIPNENGLNVDGKLAYKTQDIDVIYTFPGDYRLPKNGKEDRVNLNSENTVEDFKDLNVSVWLENTKDKFVLNALEANLDNFQNNVFGIESFKVFPNPSKVFATALFNLNEDINGKLIVSDISGRQIWEKELTLKQGENSIDIPSINTLAAGSYTIMFTSGSKLAIQEFIVQN